MFARRLPLACAAFGFILTAPTFAALVGLQWKDSPTNEMTVYPGGGLGSSIATIQLYVEQINGDTSINGVGAIFNAWEDAAATVPADFVLRQHDQRAVFPGWTSLLSGGQPVGNGYITGNGPQYLTGYGPNASVANVPGVAGKYILAEADIVFDPQSAVVTPTTVYLTFKKPGNVMHPYLIDPAGNFFSDTWSRWDADRATVEPGYLAYGDWGNPGWQSDENDGDQPFANPLVLHVAPEPGSLALVLVGLFAALRRGQR